MLAAVVLAGIVAAVVVVALGGEDEAEAQTVRFQPPTEPGPDPFTKPTDVEGEDKVRVGSGPFGGTGSDLVCDRDLLIASLRARPDRLREWARIRGIEPTAAAVTRYIRRLRPVTLIVDTRVTNHSFAGGRAVALQSILQAGTAVLVDSTGRPVVRCRCGNPLAEPIYIPEATCFACPANYEPPPPCSNYRSCWRRYPNPPRVVRYAPRRPEPTPAPPPDDPPMDDIDDPGRASFTPRVGGPTDTYVLTVQLFDPDTRLSISLTRPDGVSEDYALTTGSDGSGSFTFPNAGPAIAGTYTATVRGGGETATAQTTVRGGTDEPQQPSAIQPSQDRNNNGVRDSEEVGGGGAGTEIPDEGTQCDPPRSQLEFEICRDRGE